MEGNARRYFAVMGMVFLLAFAFLSFDFAHGQTQEESFTITTYYPSPYGTYNEFKTYSNTHLAISGGNVGIGTSEPRASLDGRTIKVDVNSGNIIADDIYLAHPKSGDARWASKGEGNLVWFGKAGIHLKKSAFCGRACSASVYSGTAHGDNVADFSAYGEYDGEDIYTSVSVKVTEPDEGGFTECEKKEKGYYATCKGGLEAKAFVGITGARIEGYQDGLLVCIGEGRGWR